MLNHTMPHVRVLHAVTNNKFHICKKLTGKYYNFAKRKGQRDSPGDYKFSFNVKKLRLWLFVNARQQQRCQTFQTLRVPRVSDRFRK